MRVRKLEVLGYKCLRFVRVNLHPFQILVGPNASGKSTFLDVLVFLNDLLRHGLEPTLQRRARSVQELTWNMQRDSCEFAVEFAIPEQLRAQLKERYVAARYEVRIGTDENKRAAITAENLWLLPQHRIRAVSDGQQTRQLFPSDPSPPARIVVEPRRQAPTGYRKVLSRTRTKRIYIRSETTNWSLQLSVSADRPGITMIPDEEARFPVSMRIRRLIAEELHFVQLNSASMRWPCRPDAPRSFQPDGSNLPVMLQQLRKCAPARFKRWIKHLRTVLSDIVDVRVKERVEDRHRYLLVKSRSQGALPSWLLSDGTLRLFAMTLLAYLPAESAIYVVEEPENGIHPKALEAVYQSLSSVYEGQVFCATHSPVLLNMAKPEELLCFARTEAGATDVVSGDRHPAVGQWQHSVVLGDLLASGILG